MSEDIDKRVLRKYEIREKLGKGVRACAAAVFARTRLLNARVRHVTRALLLLPLRQRTRLAPALSDGRTCGRRGCNARARAPAGVRHRLAMRQQEGQVGSGHQKDL